MASNKAQRAWIRHARAPQRPDLGELKRRLQRRQGARGPFDDIDAKTEEQRARLVELQRWRKLADKAFGELAPTPRRLDTSELEGLLQDAREGLTAEQSDDHRARLEEAQSILEARDLRLQLVALDREALAIERERAELTTPWWVRLLRWIVSKV